MKRLLEFLKSHPVVGLDTSIFIYHLEDHPRYAPVTEIIFHSLEEGRNRGITSFLTLMEILVKPAEYGASPSVVASIKSVVKDQILEADKILAQKAMDEARSGDPELLAEAKGYLANAEYAKAKAEYDKAVEYYFKAWEAALKSIGKI